MSTVQVANLIFESTSNNRIQSNSTVLSFVAGGVTTATANSSTLVGNLNVNTLGATNIAANTVMLSNNGISGYNSFRNKIINGNFDYWQRGTSNTSVADYQYLADRWRYRRVGSTINASRQAFTLGQTSVPGEPSYYLRSTVTSVAGAANFAMVEQCIEGVRTLAGRPVTLSFWAKADASKNIAVAAYQYFGFGGSPSASVYLSGITIPLTTSWQKFTTNITVPSISGKTLGTSNDCFVINFYFEGGSNWNGYTNTLGQQSGTFDIAQVQLEEGSVATPFEHRMPQMEFLMCQRYYQSTKSYPFDAGYRQTNQTAGNFALSMSFQYFTHMRVVPTLAVYGDISDGSEVQLNETVVVKDYQFNLFNTTATGGWIDYHWHEASAEY